MSDQHPLDNEFTKIWIASEAATSRAINLPLVYIDIVGGNLYDAILFAQIVYWHRPDKHGRTRLRYSHEGKLWLAKNHADWYEECRINERTARACLKRLQGRKLIEYTVAGFGGKKTPIMRINGKEFEALIRNCIQFDTKGQIDSTIINLTPDVRSI